MKRRAGVMRSLGNDLAQRRARFFNRFLEHDRLAVRIQRLHELAVDAVEFRRNSCDQFVPSISHATQLFVT